MTRFLLSLTPWKGLLFGVLGVIVALVLWYWALGPVLWHVQVDHYALHQLVQRENARAEAAQQAAGKAR